MTAPVVNGTVRYAVCTCTNGLHGYPCRSSIWHTTDASARVEASHPPYVKAMHHIVRRTTAEEVVTPGAPGVIEAAWDAGFTRGFYDPLAGSDRDASESAARNPHAEVAP